MQDQQNKISIVMSYFNRLTQLKNTFDTIKKTKYQNYEIILVDDGSPADQHPGVECEQSGLPIKLITIKERDKWYSNPCIPYNIAFKYIEGDNVIIQNPECMHLGDVINDANKNISDDDYLVYSCYSLTEEMSNHISNFDFKGNVFNDVLEYINPPANRAITHCADVGWYAHPTYRNAPLHFCAAMSKSNLDKLNGFDERYATGVAYDDNEFIERIKTLGLNVKFITSPIVLHQFHPLFNYQIDEYVNQLRVNMNRDLFVKITMNEKIYRAKNSRNLIETVPYKVKEFNI